MENSGPITANNKFTTIPVSSYDCLAGSIPTSSQPPRPSSQTPGPPSHIDPRTPNRQSSHIVPCTPQRQHLGLSSFPLPVGSSRPRTSWTSKEEKLLIHKRQVEALAWDEIAKFFPGKSGNACRKKYFRLLEQSLGRPPAEPAASSSQEMKTWTDDETEPASSTTAAIPGAPNVHNGGVSTSIPNGGFFLSQLQLHRLQECVGEVQSIISSHSIKAGGEVGKSRG